MKLSAGIILWIGGALLLAYPFWGILYPDSYAQELSQHYAYAEGVSAGQVKSSAAMLWLSNGVIALGFFFLAAFISRPEKSLYAKLAGTSLILYPFFRTFVEVWSGLNLTSHASGVEVPVEFSAEKLFFVAFGIALLGLAAAVSELNAPSKLEHPPA